MNASAQTEKADALIDTLRASGVDRFDPVRWHYIETLAKRATAYEGQTRRMLDAKLADALAALKERFELAQSGAADALSQGAQQFSHAARDLQRRFDAGDFKGLLQMIAALKSREQCKSLTALVHELEQTSPESPDARSLGNAGSRPELKTIRKFRDTWSKLSIDKQLAQALEQAPKNAGPINSHMLVLRSLASMREISPDYLNRFMSYAETLLCLDQGGNAGNEKPGKPKQPRAARPAKK